MKNHSVYIWINEDLNFVHTSGIVFQEFLQGIQVSNLLILRGFPNDCHFNMHLLMEYVKKNQMNGLMSEDVYRYGDFCWVDFEEEDQLDRVSPEDLASLLYMSHKKIPLSTHKVKSLNNSYAYLCHDDGWWNNVFMDDVLLYKNVIAVKLMKELKGRKKVIAMPNQACIDQIYEMCKKGLVIDFEYQTNHSVRLFTVGQVSTMDDLEEKMNRFREKSKGLLVTYDMRKKSWNCQSME